MNQRRRASDESIGESTDPRRPDEPDRRRARRRADIITSGIRDHLDVDLLLKEAVAAIGSVLQVDRVYVHLAENRTIGDIAAEWHASNIEPFWDPGRPPGALAPIFNELVDEHEALVLEDSSNPGASFSPELAQHLAGRGIAAAIVAPIISRGSLSGLLVVASVTPRAWGTSEEVRLAEISADELASALERARLFAAQRDLVTQLQELDRTKSEFLSTVSHELRTPLTSIAGYIEMLEEGDAGPVSDPQRKMLEIIGRNARRLRSLIEDLLTLSRVEVGAFHARAESVDLIAVVEAARTVIQPSVLEKGIELRVECSPGLGRILGDSDQLERVLLNLLSNAVKFTSEGGSIALSARREGADVVLAITDSGIGIPSADMEKLFTRFFRASNATERAIPGTGLGLTIVRSIVELHGGSLEVESAVDIGSTFIVRLPAASPV